MKVRSIITFSIVALIYSLPNTDVAFGQTTDSHNSATVTAHIPYDFWIDGTLLPAGEYSLSPDVPSVVVFWNGKDDVGEQAFVIPTGLPVASGDWKLVFVIHDGAHHFRAIWDSQGREVLASQLDTPLAAGDVETQVPLLEQTHASKVAQKH